MQVAYLQGQHRITMRASAMSCSARQGRQITSCSQLAQSLDLGQASLAGAKAGGMSVAVGHIVILAQPFKGIRT